MDGQGTNITRIPLLSRDNYDTWKLRIQALMTKNKTWAYASGTKPAPQAAEALQAWKDEDEKAKADLYLAVGDAELKQIRYCTTAREIWLKLESIFKSKGPAKKVSLWRRLTGHRLSDNGDVQQHVDEFFDIVDKLSELSVQVSTELQSIILLHSLPESFENFRCAIESRDELPTPENLKIKILDENTTRRQRGQADEHVMFARKGKSNTKRTARRATNKSVEKTDDPDATFKFRCHRCRKIGHKAIDCSEKNEQYTKRRENKEKAAVGEDITFLTSVANIMSCSAGNTWKDDAWCIDSGCTSHLCRNEEKFEEISTSENTKLNLANHGSTDIKAKGTVKVTATDGSKTRAVNLENTLHVPDLRNNLISVAKITDAGNCVIFTKEAAAIKNGKGTTILVADRRGDLYFLREPRKESTYAAPTEVRKSPITTWHERLGHLNWHDILEMNRKEAVSGLRLGNDKTINTCEVCAKAKLTAMPFGKQSQRSSQILDIVHTDLCGPMRNESRGKAKYVLTFTDDYSRWTEVRFLHKKCEVLQAFKEFKVLVEKQTGQKIKSLQSDNGREFCNKEFDGFLKKEGITRRLTTPYTPQLNGVAERKNRTLMEMARCLMTQSKLPISFWAEAVATACYIRNRCITKTLKEKTPHELWRGKRPNVEHMRTFGEVGYALDKIPGKGKLDMRGVKCNFLGYDEPSRSYRVWIPSKQRVTITRDIKFLNATQTSKESGSSIPAELLDYDREPVDTPKETPAYRELHIDPEGDKESEDEQQEPATIDEDREDHDTPANTFQRGPGRPKKLLTGRRGRPRKLYQQLRGGNEAPETSGEEDVDCTSNSEEQMDLDTPEVNWTSVSSEIPYQQAMSGAHKDEWENAIIEETECIIKNNTWQIVERPKHHHIVGCRMVLRNKYNTDGQIERRKARLVAKGFTQRPGIDYHDTFAPVARLGSMRLLLALAIRYDLKVHQLDITTAYLNGTIEEKIYMELPDRLAESLKKIVSRKGEKNAIGNQAKKMLEQIKGGNKVCRLQRALYGLKQAGRQWHKRLNDKLHSLDFTPTNADPCVYYLKRGGDPLFVLVYVDDILIFYHKESDLDHVRKGLLQEFDVRDLGAARCCLGIEITRGDDFIAISQSGYIRELLTRFGMEDCNPVQTPAETGVRLDKTADKSCETSETKPYQELIGALNYLAIATRPDISHTVNYLSQFNNCYNEQHWRAAKRVLRYLKGTIDFTINYTKGTGTLEGFVDADWAGCPVDRKSYTGFVFTLNNAAVSWESRKQRTVALSSTEAEYMALTEAAREALHLQKFVSELGLLNLRKIRVMNDNRGAQLLARSHTFHARSKHIDIRHHFVRDAVHGGQLEIEHLPTEKMPADFLTKGLPGCKHYRCLKLIGIRRTKIGNGATLEGEC